MIENIGREYKAECYFYSQPPAAAKIITKICNSCNIEHFLSYAENKTTKERKIFENVLFSEFISFTTETIFEILVLKSFDSHLIHNNASFRGFARSYNHFFDSLTLYINNSNKRCILNRIRLTETWFYYRFIMYYNELKNGLENFPMPYMKNLTTELNNIRSSFQPHFIKKWSSDNHLKKCNNLLCSTAIVVDGNHKINRLKCVYDDQYVKIPELETMKQTGCKKTPSLNSYFCESHKSQSSLKNFKFRKSFLSIDINTIKGKNLHKNNQKK